MWYLSGIYIFYIFFLNRREEYNIIIYFYVYWYVFYVNWYVFDVYWYVKFSLYEFGVLVVYRISILLMIIILCNRSGRINISLYINYI